MGYSAGHPVEGEEITPEDRDAFAEYVREDGHFSISANRVGRSAQAFRYWMDKLPDFKRRVLRARGEWAAEQCKRVKSGEWNLARAYPDDLGDRQTLNHEGGVQVVLTPHPDMLDDDPETQ